MARDKDTLPTHLPTLFIGLGGAGATIVNRIAQILRNSSNWSEMEDIFQFFIVDTDRAMIDSCPYVPFAHKFIISGFDKGIYAAMKRGTLGQEANEPDPRVTQWLHPWYNFRASRGAGAGQIRIESRLSIYNALESGDLIGRLRSAIGRSLHYKIPNVDTRTKELRVFLYFSVAGGTGSGSHLTLAYLLRHLAEQFGLKADITAVAILPTLFMDLIHNHRQQTDLLCNGYASLKEIEHLMKLKITSDERDPGNRREFAFLPQGEGLEVREPPFDFVYIIDIPPDLNVGQEFRDVVADGIYLQLNSPIFATRGSDFDNYEKNQKRFAADLYSVFYGSFGCSILVLPDRDILQYCVLRQTAKVFQDYFISTFRTSDNRRFPTEEEEMEWASLDERLQNRHRDMAYLRYVVHEHSLRSADSASAQTGRGESLGSTQRMFRLTGTASGSLASLHDLLEEERRDDVLKKAVRRMLEMEELQDVAVTSDEFPAIDSRLVPRAVYETTAELMYDVKVKALGAGDGVEEGDDIDEEGQEKMLVYGGWRKVTHEVIFGPNGLVHALDETVQPPQAAAAPVQAERRANPSVAEEVIVEHAARMKNWSEDLGLELRRFMADARNQYGTTKAIMRLLQEAEGDTEIDLLTLRLYFVVLREELMFFHEASDRIMQERGLVPEVIGKVNAIFDRIKNQNFEDLGPDSIEQIRKEAKVSRVEGIGGRDEHQKFVTVWESNFQSHRSLWVNTLRSYYFLDGLKSLCKTILEPIDNFLDTLRSFNRVASQKRNDIEREVDNYLREAGEEANRFVVDVEVLENVQGQRLWDKYYEQYVQEQRRLPTDEVLRILTDVFLSEQLSRRPDDIAEAIKVRVSELSRLNLHDLIIGRYSDGNERDKRGLLIDDALKKEAELCYIDHLKASGRFPELAETYALYRDAPQSSLASVELFRQELASYTAGYLEVKLNKCIRTSGVLANIDTNSKEVTEFGCRQSIMAYDQELYGKPDANPESGLDHFPSVVRRISEETKPDHWSSPESAKRVIFYKALLGAPLFVFNNVRGLLREAYNRRVEERNPLNPYKGRRYPLHIDRNWEPKEPDADLSKMPLSLDPDEAVQSRSSSDQQSHRLMWQFLTLLDRGEISWDEGKGFHVVPGKLGNPLDLDEVVLGPSLRRALQTVQMSPAAVDLVEKTAGDRLLNTARLHQIRDTFKQHVAPNVWNKGDSPNPDTLDTADMLEDLVKWLEEEEIRAGKKETEPQLGRILGSTASRSKRSPSGQETKVEQSDEERG
jgi:hypothetical protein